MDQYLKAIELYKDIFKDSDVLSKYVFFNENNIITYAVEMEDDKVIACGFCRKKKIRFGSSVKVIPYIFGIATHPEYRHKGYASKIIVKLLSNLNEMGYAFTMLTPANSGLYAFYYQFGFVKFNYVKKVALRDLLTKKDVLVEADRNDQLLTTLFNSSNETYDICQYRELDNTKTRVEEVLIDSGRLIYINNDDKVCGYLLLDEQKNVCEFVRTNILSNETLINENVISNFDLDLDKTANMSYLYPTESNIYPKEVIRIIDPEKMSQQLKENSIGEIPKNKLNIYDEILDKNNLDSSKVSIQKFSEDLFNINNSNIKRAFFEEW